MADGAGKIPMRVSEGLSDLSVQVIPSNWPLLKQRSLCFGGIISLAFGAGKSEDQGIFSTIQLAVATRPCVRFTSAVTWKARVDIRMCREICLIPLTQWRSSPRDSFIDLNTLFRIFFGGLGSGLLKALVFDALVHYLARVELRV